MDAPHLRSPTAACDTAFAAGKETWPERAAVATGAAPPREPPREPQPEPEPPPQPEPESRSQGEPNPELKPESRPESGPAPVSVGVRSWPMQDRPRERMFSHGPAALSDTELVALLLRSGNRGLSAMNLARQLLHAHGALTELLASSPHRMARLPGIGPARAASLLAVRELALRAQRERLERKTLLGRPAAVKDYLSLLLHGRSQEVFVVLFLDSQNRLILADELFHGTLNQTAVYPREVVRRALELNAAAVILAHNHPSGVAEPSQADRVLTDALRAALRHLDIPVLDHIIVAAGSTFSFAEHGYL